MFLLVIHLKMGIFAVNSHNKHGCTSTSMVESGIFGVHRSTQLDHLVILFLISCGASKPISKVLVAPQAVSKHSSFPHIFLNIDCYKKKNEQIKECRHSPH